MLPELMWYQEKKVFSPITLSGHAMDPAWAVLPETPEQVTLGHIIIADGWAGASNPRTFHPYTHAHFPLFDIIILVRRTDRRTDKASYRVACPDLKKDF